MKQSIYISHKTVFVKVRHFFWHFQILKGIENF